MAEAGKTRIEAVDQAQENWVRHVAELAGGTLIPTCNSWHLGANIPGRPRVFMPYIGCPPYRAICGRAAAEGYRGVGLR